MGASPHTDAETPTPEIDQVRTYRRAARLIIRSPRPRTERLKALVALGAKARESGVGVLVQEAVWLESKAFIRDEPPPPPVNVSSPVEAAVRRQLRAGRVRCESCKLPLPTEEQLDRARRGRIAELERRRLFEEAGQ